jgi:CRP/FNR family cyclic AMP-dependent transcriptional regulator
MRAMAERPKDLSHLDHLGDATQFSGQIHALIPKCKLIENFSTAEVRLLSHFMDVYNADSGAEIIHEGAGGDFMMLILEGKVEVVKQDRWNRPQVIAVVDPGKTLGEMSMIDGEPRFATCIAVEPTTVAVLDRENLARIIVEQPMLGAKILMELVLMLSQRLRMTSSRLMQLLNEQADRAANTAL